MTGRSFRWPFWDTCHGTSDNAVMEICVGGVSCQRADVWQAQWHLTVKLWYLWRTFSLSPCPKWNKDHFDLKYTYNCSTFLGVLMNMFIVSLWWFRILSKEWVEKSSSGKVQQCAKLWRVNYACRDKQMYWSNSGPYQETSGGSVCVYLC